MKFKSIISSMLFCTFLLTFASCSVPGANNASEGPSSDKPVQTSTPPTGTILEADSMDRLCKPAVTGDFIQAWYCRSWDESKWDSHLEMLKKAGMDTVILQSTSDMKNGKFSVLDFETSLAKNKSLISENLSYSPDCLGSLLESAKTNGFKVFIGLSFDSDWWDEGKAANPEYYKKWAEMETKTIKAIYDNYYKKYKEQISGWYWSWEMYSNGIKLEEHWSKMMNLTLDFITKLDPNIPLMFAPYISDYHNVTPERHGEMWEYMMANTNFRKGDIIAPQDSFGTSGKPLPYIEKHIKTVKEKTTKDGRLKFWLDVENFDNSNPAKIDRFINQLDISSKYAENMVCFSYSHYYNPEDRDEKYDTAYREYLKTIK